MWFVTNLWTMTVEESEELCRTVASTGRVFALTHNYTGYPMVKQAKHLVQSGAIGGSAQNCG